MSFRKDEIVLDFGSSDTTKKVIKTKFPIGDPIEVKYERERVVTNPFIISGFTA